MKRIVDVKRLVKELFKKLMHPSWHPKPIDRWKSKFETGYVIDRRIFGGMMVLVILGLVGALSIEKFDFTPKVYIHCPETSPCTNVLYQTCDEYYCQMETLPPGFTVGEPPSKTYTYYPLFVFIVVVLGFLFNHYKYNKNFVPPGDVLK
jgi:hypothetical protein